MYFHLNYPSIEKEGLDYVFESLKLINDNDDNKVIKRTARLRNKQENNTAFINTYKTYTNVPLLNSLVYL